MRRSRAQAIANETREKLRRARRKPPARSSKTSSTPTHRRGREDDRRPRRRRRHGERAQDIAIDDRGGDRRAADRQRAVQAGRRRGRRGRRQV